MNADDMPNANQTVVVTGASAGVGRAIAVGFAERGWRVALIARGAEGLEGDKKQIEALGARASTIRADVGDAEAVMQAADRVEQGWARSTGTCTGLWPLSNTCAPATAAPSSASDRRSPSARSRSRLPTAPARRRSADPSRDDGLRAPGA